MAGVQIRNAEAVRGGGDARSSSKSCKKSSGILTEASGKYSFRVKSGRGEAKDLCGFRMSVGHMIKRPQRHAGSMAFWKDELFRRNTSEKSK
jgi:hypothetical protein